MSIYKEYTLTCMDAYTALGNFLRAHTAEAIRQNKPLKVIITSEEKPRHSQQNKYYWGVVLAQFAEQAWANHKQFSAEVWHEYLAQKYCPHTEFVLPDQTILTRRKSTSEFSVSEFAEYVAKCQAYGAELGVIWDV